MRACALLLLAALILANSELVACLVSRNQGRGMHAGDAAQHGHRSHGHHHRAMPALGQQHHAVNAQADHGTGYKLLSMFIAAMHYQNYTWASSLLADTGSFIITDLSCGTMDKASFMSLAMTDGVAASQVILGEWTETAGGTTIVHAEIGAIFGAMSKMPNQTYYNPNVYYIVAPSLDGTQLATLQRWSDASMRQTNASSMMNTFNTVIAATTLGDINPWRSMLAPDFVFSMFYPFDSHTPFSANATAFLDVLLHQYQNQLSCSVQVRSVFPVCDFVAAEVMVFIQNKMGPAMVHKYFLSMRLDGWMRINLMQEFGLGLM